MNWHVLHTRPRCEKKVEQKLLSLGIEAYCPTRPEIRLWCDRKKRVDVPLLSSMVLVKIDSKEINRVFECSLVVRYMFWLGNRAIVRQSEVDILKKYLDKDYTFIDSTLVDIKVGDNLKLSSFNNEQGVVESISNNNVWINLKSIGYSVKLKLA